MSNANTLEKLRAKLAADEPMNRDAKRTRGHARAIFPVLDGCVFVFSDAHMHPEEPETPAYTALLQLAKLLQPYGLVNNGDTLDLAAISRFPSASYRELKGTTTIIDEIETVQKRLKPLEELRSVKYRSWNLGNHDSRFESYLAKAAAQYAGIPGFELKDHFQQWIPAWSTHIGNEVIIKHRFKGGMYAARNNALNAGRSYVSGHLHRLYAMPVTDVNGIRWGIEAGTLADVSSRYFVDYTEDNPVDWQSGFAILWFEDGKFAGPELVYAMPDGRVLFRGGNIT